MKGIELIDGVMELNGYVQQNTIPIKQNNEEVDFHFGQLNLNFNVTSSPLKWLDLKYTMEYRRDFLSSNSFNSSTQSLFHKCLFTIYPREDLTIKLDGFLSNTYINTKQSRSTALFNADLVYRYKQIDAFLSV